MAKNKRYFEDGYPYFITTVTHNREQIFANMKNSKIILVMLEFFKLTLNYKIFAYCLMPDHLHIILQPDGKKVWQERFYDTGIRSIGMLLQKIEYIHNNPVRAGIATQPDHYPLSSYAHYFGKHYSGIPEIDQLT